MEKYQSRWTESQNVWRKPRDMMVFSVDALLEHSLQARRAIHIMTRRGELEVCRIGARSLLEPFPGKRLYLRRRKLTTLFEEREATAPRAEDPVWC